MREGTDKREYDAFRAAALSQVVVCDRDPLDGA
jgi:hypothetical protein